MSESRSSPPRAPGVVTALRYTVAQLPGLIVIGVIVLWLWSSGTIEGWIAAVVLAAWVAKDAVLYPFFRRFYEPQPPQPLRPLVGALGTAREALDPEGYIRVGDELWRAVVPSDQAPVPPGSTVRVAAVKGLTLEVTPVRYDEEAHSAGARE
jgi:membrane protein implicated in regulation of membrane protease activity